MIFKQLLFLSFFLGILSFSSTAQTWQTATKNDPFSGNYKIAFIKGVGDEFPFQKPQLTIQYWEESERLKIYITQAGYAGCDNQVAYLKFPNDLNIYWCISGTDKKEDIWYLDLYLDKKGEEAYTLDLLKKYSQVTVRLDSDCDTKDFKFSLNGSTKAIEFVTSKLDY